MPDDRKTVYVNDKPISIFIWAEVQHCINAYDSELYSKVRKGEAEIVDEKATASAGAGSPWTAGIFMSA